ncbi:MAG TPA: hypothetical protein VKY45_04005 [Marinilabiliaceae bacterium]|nr:hypothetical protein [Marinilabiliaceae bacterium]
MKNEHENNFTGESLLFYFMTEFLQIDTAVQISTPPYLKEGWMILRYEISDGVVMQLTPSINLSANGD